MPTLISLTLLAPDKRAQPRGDFRDHDVIREYAEAMRDGVTFPPVVVFGKGGQPSYILADGFHRVNAVLLNAREHGGREEIMADVREGDGRDAMLYAASANITHGLRRTNADKRRAVLLLLEDPEWAAWSDNMIAAHCGVSQNFVSSLRRELRAAGREVAYTPKRLGRNGKVQTIREPRPVPKPSGHKTLVKETPVIRARSAEYAQADPEEARCACPCCKH